MSGVQPSIDQFARYKVALLIAAQMATPLRMVIQRLSSTPTAQLPHVAPVLAGSITDSRKAFIIAHNESKSKSGSEMNVLIHKLKAQLSALLQDKSPQARYSALILIKATIEVGGWNVLQGSGAWVRAMIANLRVSCSIPNSKGLNCQQYLGTLIC